MNVKTYLFHKRHRFMNMKTGEIIETDHLSKFAEMLGVQNAEISRLVNGKARRVGDLVVMPSESPETPY